ncbi:regulator of microtubule dynamics protein 2-like, partial [Tropilaelaps mercedesae]
MEAAIERCDKLSDSGHLVEALGTIANFKNESDPEVQWRYGRAIFKEAELKGSGPKAEAIGQALEVLKKSLAENDDCANLHVWYAIVIGSKDKHESFKQKIE